MEDVVQECLLDTLRAYRSFRSGSQEEVRAWGRRHLPKRGGTLEPLLRL